MPGYELAGVVAELGYGTTGLTVVQQVFGLADWTRDGSLPSTPRWRPAWAGIDADRIAAAARKLVGG